MWRAARDGAADLLGRELLAAVRAARSDDLAAAGSRHAGAEAVTTLTHELAGLISSLHGAISEWPRIDPRCARGRAGYSLALKCVCKREQRPSRAPRRDGAAYGARSRPSQFRSVPKRQDPNADPGGSVRERTAFRIPSVNPAATSCDPVRFSRTTRGSPDSLA